jgi:hypothetical protein
MLSQQVRSERPAAQGVRMLPRHKTRSAPTPQGLSARFYFRQRSRSTRVDSVDSGKRAKWISGLVNRWIRTTVQKHESTNPLID